MASVQPAAAAQIPQGSSLPANVSQSQAHGIAIKFQQMKDMGVSPTDPDYIRLQQWLLNFEQHRKHSAQAQALALQLPAQQQQQQGQSGPSAIGPDVVAANGVQHGLTPSQLSSSSPVAQALPNPAQIAHGTFTAQQMLMLRQQFAAFKMLSKNAGIPLSIQLSIFGQRYRKQAVLEAASSALPSYPQLGSSAVLSADNDKKELTNGVQEPRWTSVQSPHVASDGKLDTSYWGITRGRPRVIVPSLLPTGVDWEALRQKREIILRNRLTARYHELKSLPADIAHWDSSADDVVVDSRAKLAAVIEMKKILLFEKQRALRERVGRQMLQFDNMAMTTNRSSYRRLKKMSVREARVTEKLEKQQRDARELREKKRHHDFLTSIREKHAVMARMQDEALKKSAKLGRFICQQHSSIEKEEQKRIERTAKQRLQALKANDEEAYLKLLDQAKDTRITHLLKQTDGFLHQLASSVRKQQRAAAERYGTSLANDEPEVLEENNSDDEEGGKKIDYYAVAHRIQEEVTKQADILVGGTLKEYQIKGLQWMISLYNNNLNGILADEMGLGKTIQTISLITYLIEQKQQEGPYLVIVPLSTLTNWNLEFEKWAPSVSRIVYKGPPNARKTHQDRIRQGRFQVLLTTYEFIIKDRPILSKIKWFHMIIDEGHRMKNSNSKLSATISQHYSTRFRLILTGTPLQNNLGELWAMLNFVLPNIFKSAKTFDEWFNTPFANTGGQDKMELTEEEQILVIRRLHKVLRPFLLRRLKKDVEKDLPDKTEKVIKCKFSALQFRLNKQMVAHQRIAVGNGKNGKAGARGLSNMIMQLRKLCNHPFVFDEVENQMNPESTSNDLLWRTSGKFELLDRILPKYQASGHRVLMFFQMTAIMDIMEDFLRYRNIKYLRLDGTTKSEDRSELLRVFNAPNSEYFMFLLSTRAGGLGLNLQTADTVIIYDSDWNPHQDLQAQDRAHRIGQKNEVRILRLISSNSVEEKILERARYKLDMDSKVIQAGRFDNKSSETDRDAMLRTLLETADMAESGDPDEMDDEELNMILARSDEEVTLFQKLDEERYKDPIYGTAPGCLRRPRLMTEDELPEIYLNEGNPEEEATEAEVLGRGARERTKVKYDDGLTEEQWLMAVDDDDDSPEAAAARKQARKERREANRSRRSKGSVSAGSPSAASRASTEEPVEQLPPQPKKRGRKPGSKNAPKRKAGEEGVEEPPAKKQRGPKGRPRAVSSSGPLVPDAKCSTLNASMRKILEEMHDIHVTFEPQKLYAKEKAAKRRAAREAEGNINGDAADVEEEVVDDSNPEAYYRHLLKPFLKLPSKRDYANYYYIIKQPICIRIIDQHIKRDEYTKLSDMRADIHLMCNNCRTFNEDGSLLYKDANYLQDWFETRYLAELKAKPELQSLEDGPLE